MKKWLGFVLLAVLLFPPLAGAQNKPALNARSAILIDSRTAEVLYSKNSYYLMAPASTTKIMTAVLVLEKLKLDQTKTVSRQGAALEGTSMGLVSGEQRTIRDLLYGMMLVSGNDAAYELARAVSGTESKFAELMTEKARMVGMKNTVFKNASGLPAVGHYTTAYDLALLARYALKVDGFARVVSTKTKEVPGSKPGQVRKLTNHNKLLWRYSYATGMKTGYTRSAGGCLVSSATHNGRTLISVVLKTQTIYDDTVKLFNYGFELRG